MPTRLSKIASIFLSLFKKVGGLFRDGLQQFIEDNIERAIETALEVLAEEGFTNGDEFFRKLWKRLRMEIFGPHDTWTTILAGFALDAVKKKVKADPRSVAGVLLNPWVLK